MSKEAKIKAESDSLKEELVKKKVELSMHTSEDKRVQEQLKRVENQKDLKQTELEKARKTLAIAQTANEAEQKAVSNAEADVRNAAAEGKVRAQAQQRKVAEEEQDEKELAANVKNADKQLQEKQLSVSALKDKVSRMQTDLEEESVELEAATKRERAAKDKKTEEEHKQAELRRLVSRHVQMRFQLRLSNGRKSQTS